MRRGLRKVVESPRTLPRSGPASLMPPVTASPAAFRLTSGPSRSTVEPESGGYLGDVGSWRPRLELDRQAAQGPGDGELLDHDRLGVDATRHRRPFDPPRQDAQPIRGGGLGGSGAIGAHGSGFPHTVSSASSVRASGLSTRCQAGWPFCTASRSLGLPGWTTLCAGGIPRGALPVGGGSSHKARHSTTAPRSRSGRTRCRRPAPRHSTRSARYRAAESLRRCSAGPISTAKETLISRDSLSTCGRTGIMCPRKISRAEPPC